MSVKHTEVNDLLEKTASALRQADEIIKRQAAELAEYRRKEQVTKLASDLAHQGYVEREDAEEYVNRILEDDIPLDVAQKFFHHTAPGFALDMSKTAAEDDYNNVAASPEDRLVNSILSNSSNM